MTDLASDKSFMTEEETKFRSANSEPFIQKISSNINFLIDAGNQDFQLGDIIQTFLTQAEVDTIFGSNKFVIPSGQSIAGSDLDTSFSISSLPDARASFLRGLDNGRGVDTGRVIATAQTAQNLLHSHNLINSDPTGDSSDFWTDAKPHIGTQTFRIGFPDALTIVRTISGAFRNITSEAEGEGRPHNLALNIFIRINT